MKINVDDYNSNGIFIHNCEIIVNKGVNKMDEIKVPRELLTKILEDEKGLLEGAIAIVDDNLADAYQDIVDAIEKLLDQNNLEECDEWD